MKTPREILLNNHKVVETELDGLRQQFLRGLRSSVQFSPQQQPGVVESSVCGWREMLLFAQWHLTGMAAIWLLVVILRISDNTVDAQPSVQAKTVPSPSLILTVIENRRQILELSNGAAIVSPLVPGAPLQRRSRGVSIWAYA